MSVGPMPLQVLRLWSGRLTLWWVLKRYSGGRIPDGPDELRDRPRTRCAWGLACFLQYNCASVELTKIWAASPSAHHWLPFLVLLVPHNPTALYILSAMDTDWARSRAAHRSVPYLLRALHDEFGRIRFEVASALANIADERGVKQLLSDLQSEDYLNRDAVVRALEAGKGSFAADALVRRLASEPESFVRSQIARTLDALEWTPRTIEEKMVYLWAKQKWNEMVAEGPVSIPYLVAAARDSKESAYVEGQTIWAHEAALKSLIAFRSGALVPLVQVLEDATYPAKSRAVAAESLGILRDGRAVEPLIRVLQDVSAPAECRGRAAEALGVLNDTRAVAPLIGVLWSLNWCVRRAAALALGRLGDRSAVEPLTRALREGEAWDEAAREYHRRAALVKSWMDMGDNGGDCAATPVAWVALQMLGVKTPRPNF